MANYILQQDINFFGRIIKAGTVYVQKGADYYWPIINDAHVPTGQLDFYTVKNNPEWFKEVPAVVSSFNVHDNFPGNGIDAFWFQFCSSKKIDLLKHQIPIQRAIESIINAE